MPPFFSTAEAVGFLASRRNGFGHLIKRAKSNTQLVKNDRFRCIRNIAGVESPVLLKLIDPPKEELQPSPGSFAGPNTVQIRRFLGCGDGEEGEILSKVYEERRVLGYSPEQLFDVVAAVDLYQGFVPWCQRSDVLKHYPDGSFDAELEIGFKFLVESYVSHVEFERPKYVKSTVSESSLFDHLINIWEFNPGPVPGTCNIYFLVDFKFQSPLYRQLASMFFKEVVSKLVGSFTDRCKLIYGPPVPVLESAYEHKA